MKVHLLDTQGNVLANYQQFIEEVQTTNDLNIIKNLGINLKISVLGNLHSDCFFPFKVTDNTTGNVKTVSDVWTLTTSKKLTIKTMLFFRF